MVLFDLPAYVSYALVALALALSYLGIARLLRLGADFRYRRRRLPRLQPGEPVRRELRRNHRRLASHLHACLLALLSFGLLLLLGQRGWWPDWPERAWVALAVLLLIPCAYAAVKLTMLLSWRRHLLRLLALHDDVAERLAEAELRGNRLHFSVPSEAGYIDAVVVGPNGVYALLLQPAPENCTELRIADGRLYFDPVGLSQPTDTWHAVAAGLSRNIEAGSGQRVIVQPVLVVPGGRLVDSDDDRLLVLSLEACVSFIGWRNPRAFLMDDELRAVDAWLARARGAVECARLAVPDQTGRFASRLLPQPEL